MVMNIIDKIFQRKSIIVSNLEPYGFVFEGKSYIYKKTLEDSGLVIQVTISVDGKASAKIIDTAIGEPYTMHLASSASGEFVGRVRNEYENLLMDIAKKCCMPDVFKSNMTKALIAYVRDIYGDEPEFLWEKFPDNAIWRRKDNRKWYGALLTVSKKKLGLESDEVVEIIDIMERPEIIKSLLEQSDYYPGWHMNKKHWDTIILDGTVSFEEICRRIDISHKIAGNKR